MPSVHYTQHSRRMWPLISTFDYACLDNLNSYNKEEETIIKFQKWDKELLTENQNLKEEIKVLKSKLHQ